MTPPDVAVVVVTFNNADEIDACVAAALAQEDLEVVVVDNASTDGTVAALRAFGDRIRLVESPVNTGFAGGVNVGVRTARAPLVLLLNPDCVMDAGCVAALRAHLEAATDAGVSAALLRNPDGSPQLFCRRDLTLANALWDLTRIGAFVDRRMRGGRGAARRRYAEVDWGRVERPVRVEVPAAACALVRREPGGAALMDERFPLYFNDADLYRRLRARGLHAEVVPAARATHGYGTTVRRLDLAANRAEFVAAMRRYAHRHWRRPAALALDALLLLDGGLSAARYALLRGRDYDDVVNARGVLGAFGLPLGVAPPLSRPR